MALPVMPVTMPSALSGQQNGRLAASLLVSTPGLSNGPVVRLTPVAARCWRAMTAVAAKAGHIFKATSYADSYRDYSTQVNLFTSRYTTTYLAGRPWRMWQGVRWYQKPNTAVAAVPGTSNHGWALAVDIGEERDGDAGTESIDQGSVNWLVANAFSFGFSAEIQSEPWHWRVFIGDAVPAAVLAWEKGNNMDPNAYNGDAYLNAVLAMAPSAKVIPTQVNSAATYQAPNKLAATLNEIKTAVAGIGAPSQEQVNAAVKAALSDPAVLSSIARAVADEQAARLKE